MKLVIATPLYPPEIGGPATYAKLLYEGLPKMGRSDLPKIEVELVKFSDVRYLPKFIRHYAYYLRVLKAARSADVVLALDPVSVGLPAMKAARRAGKPFVVKIVGDYAWEQGQQRFGIKQNLDEFVKTERVSFPVRMFRRIQTRVARNAMKIIVPSEYLKGIVAAWGISPEKIHVIYNAVPLEPLGAVPEHVVALPRPLVVTAARLVPWKGVEGVIDAVANLSGASLAIVGDGPDRVALARHASEKLPGRAVLTGMLSHKDTLAVIKCADVFVLNSSYEGLSHLLIEAVMLGVPVVATRVGGNSEVIRNGVNGTLVSVGDIHALTNALQERQPPTEDTAGQFSVERMLTATARLLTSL